MEGVLDGVGVKLGDGAPGEILGKVIVSERFESTSPLFLRFSITDVSKDGERGAI